MTAIETRDGERKLLAILKTLSRCTEPLGSNTITRILEQEGLSLSERGVRYHLKIADQRGYTQSYGRGGRKLTDRGQQELRQALAVRQMGSAANKLKMLAYQTSFDPVKRTGALPINTSLIDKEKFKQAVFAMKAAYDAGFCVSNLAATALEGEKLGSVIVPEGKIGFATPCSVAVNGVLLKAGIPTEYKYGGLLEIKSTKPTRFVAIIDFEGTSLDPSEEFISSHVTGVQEAAGTGNGIILAVYRTIPLAARSAAEEKIAALREAGMGGVYATGVANEPFCQIRVDLNRFGIIQLNGLNPIAAAVESGIEIENYAGSGLIDYSRLQPFDKIRVEDYRVHRSHCQGE
jgi:HTH-type transcriptional regulator, global nitrogen regulator NrpRI